MATLKAMLKLYDGYSATIDKINQKTDKAIDKMLKASGSTDKFNDSLGKTEAAASRASLGLGKFLSLAALMTGAKFAAGFADEYTNTAARLDLINDKTHTQLELQDKIFAAAERSRGSYSEMAGAISKMGLLAGDAFGSNNELIAFTELVQKSFKVGGADKASQQGGMRQLTQAMASGRLQGDELVSVMENAPLIYQAIAKYMGLSKGELKELSSQGSISADIIKNAMFKSGADIDQMFKKMPITFGDIWNKIGRGATKAFRPIMQMATDIINTDGFNTFINSIIVGFGMASSALSGFINLVMELWSVLGPILIAIGAGIALYLINMLYTSMMLLAGNILYWYMLNAPIISTIAIIAGVMFAMQALGITFEDVFSFIGGIIGGFVAFWINIWIFLWNYIANFVNFLGNVFQDPVASIQTLFYDMTLNVLKYIHNMAKGIEDIINKIPGVEVSITSGLGKFMDNYASMSKGIKDKAGFVDIMQEKDFIGFDDAYNKGSGLGKDLYKGIEGKISGFTSKLTGSGGGFDMSKFGTNAAPLTVKGKGDGGKVDVKMDKEDLQYLRDLAEREFVNKFSSATLAPNIQITFGDVHEEADANKVAGRIKKILQEEIATVAEGVY